ncbi:MAG: hypothetical protein HY287_01515 [Planctomycetes bacterium]|nr:hypothetical protein [Planctomycetota bacterium]MBI3832986.1 hypothetical protein [Planctomycetota bacterium]
MKFVKKTALTLLTVVALTTSTGCNESAGWADGVSKGVSAAVQAVITAAIAQPIATLFPKPPSK